MSQEIDIKKLELQMEYLDKYEQMVAARSSDQYTEQQKLDAVVNFKEVQDRYQGQVAAEAQGEERGWQKVLRR